MYKNYVFGVDLGGTTVKMGLFKTDGNLLDMWEIPTRTEENGKNILSDIANAINSKLIEKNISKSDIEGIGIGVPGPVNDDGTVLKCVNLGWGIFNVENVLSELTGLKVKAGNDANVAALGEMWQGGGIGYKNIVMVTLGTGVGGGVVINGKVVAGATGAAGEIGHINVNSNDKTICSCGNTGCLELFSSATGVVRNTKRYLEQNPDIQTSLHEFENLQAKDIFDCAKNNDKIAIEQCDIACKYLGKALALIACVVNPEIFVIGGGMARAGQIIIDATQKYFKEQAFHACCETKFKQATLGNNAGIYGSAYMIIS